MLAGISATFGLLTDKIFLSTIVGSIIAGAGGTLAGRSIVTGLLKMIPGAGSVLVAQLQQLQQQGLQLLLVKPISPHWIFYLPKIMVSHPHLKK